MPFNAVGLPLEYCSKHYRAQQSTKPDSKKQNQKTLTPQVLWKPQNPQTTPISLYRHHVNRKFSQSLLNSHSLQKWSVTNPHDFWIDLYEYTGIIPPLPPNIQHAYDPNVKMRDIPTFFPGHKLNYAENVLVPNTKHNPNGVALVGIREGQLDDPETITWTELCELVRVTRSALIHHGVRKSDVVAALMSNSIWIIVVFLATASIGAYFTSIAPDMGVSGCVSRLVQVTPKILFTDIDFALRGTRHNLLGKIGLIQRQFREKAGIGSVPPQVVFVPSTHAPHLKRNYEYTRPFGALLSEFLSSSKTSDELRFERVETSHPLVILYSSGTTGTPKCILSPHGSILNYKKIAYLHNSLSPGSTVFQYSSTSWVVWNVMVGHLSVGARLICYDGGALYPSPATLLDICSRFHVTYWGTSPRYLLELEQAHNNHKINPSDFDLSSLRMTTTTGATLTGPQMRWFYTFFAPTVHLSSIAGGTEIASSWIASDPAGPLHENEMQMWALGHDCDVLDPETAVSYSEISSSEPGELVCKKPFVSMPVGFWNDDARRSKWRESYFERFPLPTSPSTSTSNPVFNSQATAKVEGEVEYMDIWTVNDVTTRNPTTHGLQITSRSDSTLNPSGIRFGPSEIYSIISNHPDLNRAVSDSLCVGRKRQGIDKDESVFLFLIPNTGSSIDDSLIAKVKDEIRRGLSERHVPKFVFGLPAGGIPYTINGKKVEVVVRRIISGESVREGMVSTVVNGECLKDFERFRNVERDEDASRKKRETKL